LCWLPFIRALTRSIAQMDRVTAQIAEGRFDAHVADTRPDELGHLGREINRLGARLQGFVKNQKRFVGDIAHELCAPIARIQFALGILERKADGELKPHVAVLHEEIQEMSALVNELLSFSKAGLDAGTTPLAAVGVAAVAQKAVAREAFASASIEIAVAPDVSVMANEALLLRALSNIVRNAIRYAGDQGPIRITAAPSGSDVEISIADQGPGLPKEELEDVFAPFYRPESARTRETGGAGLGLAIVRTCVEACGGTVACRNRVPRGLDVTIRLQAG
jgi:two-component system sensor histidine kinase CpxA